VDCSLGGGLSVPLGHILTDLCNADLTGGGQRWAEFKAFGCCSVWLNSYLESCSDGNPQSRPSLQYIVKTLTLGEAGQMALDHR
jgi:hypothetical protein